MRHDVEMPELSICGMPLRRTTTFFASFDHRLESAVQLLAGSPMVSRPWTSSTDTPPDWRR